MEITFIHTEKPWKISRRTITKVESEGGRSICSTGAYNSNINSDTVDLENQENAKLVTQAPEMRDYMIRRYKELYYKLLDFPDEEDSVSWRRELGVIKNILEAAGVNFKE